MFSGINNLLYGGEMMVFVYGFDFGVFMSFDLIVL